MQTQTQPQLQKWYYNPDSNWTAQCTALDQDTVTLKNSWLTWIGSRQDFEEKWEETIHGNQTPKT